MPEIKMRVLNIESNNYSVSPSAKITLEIINQNRDEEIISVVGKIGIFLEFVEFDNFSSGPVIGREFLSSTSLVTSKFTDKCITKVEFPITAEMDAAILYRLRESKRTNLLPLIITLDGFVLYKPNSESDKILYYQLPTEPTIETRYYLNIENWNNIIRTFYGADLVWIKLRRDIVDKLEEIKRKKFYLSYSDLINDLLSKFNEGKNDMH